MKFVDLGLSAELLKAIADVGYDTPTPIQQEAIPVILTGRDVLGCAQTGTGKTAGFTLPMIEILSQGRAKVRMPRSLIIAPTRELATQVSQNFELYGKYNRLSMALLIGGESFSDQEKVLDRGADVLIATPGRLLDMFDRGRILLNDVKILVIDEADRMLDMGFIPDVERIVGLLPKIRQTLFFSATMAPEIRRLADAFLTNPKEITVSPPSSTATAITQRLVVVNTIDKREALRQILRTENVQSALIFCNRKRDVEILYRSLTKHNFPVQRMHGDMPQSARTETLEKFKNSDAALMVCSDVAARGLDIAALPYVFNFDVPIHAEDYVHRIGRTGRAGREGNAVTIATAEDGKYVAAIEKLIGKKIPVIELDGLPKADLSMEGRGRGKNRKDDRPRKEDDRPRKEKDSANSNNSRHNNDTQRSAAPRQQPQPPTNGNSNSGNGNGRHSDKIDPRQRGYRRRSIDEFGIGEMSHSDDVVGFGQHVPNFMATPIVFPSKTSDKDDYIDDESDVLIPQKQREKKSQDKSSGKKSASRKQNNRKTERKSQSHTSAISSETEITHTEENAELQVASVQVPPSSADEGVIETAAVSEKLEATAEEKVTVAQKETAAKDAPIEGEPTKEKKKAPRKTTAAKPAAKRTPRTKKNVDEAPRGEATDVVSAIEEEAKAPKKKAPARKPAAKPRKSVASKKTKEEAASAEAPSSTENSTPATTDTVTGEG